MKEKGFNTPVLLLIFNKPDTLEMVINALRKVKPAKIYVGADGPKKDRPELAEKCRKAREVIENIDWPCEVKKLYREENLGIRFAPPQAIDWFFEHEEEGIIVEEDCVPNFSFFHFCADLLKKYRRDSRIMHIGGNNYHFGWSRDPDYSYYFSYHNPIWGWATWRRAWRYYDIDMKNFEEIARKKYIDHLFTSEEERKYFFDIFEKTYRKDPSVSWWSYQWLFAKYVQSGLSIIPKHNLVTNAGFSSDSVNTVDPKHKLSSLRTRELDFPLKHPPFIIRDRISDQRHTKTVIGQPALKKVVYKVRKFVPGPIYRSGKSVYKQMKKIK